MAGSIIVNSYSNCTSCGGRGDNRKENSDFDSAAVGSGVSSCGGIISSDSDYHNIRKLELKQQQSQHLQSLLTEMQQAGDVPGLFEEDAAVVDENSR